MTEEEKRIATTHPYACNCELCQRWWEYINALREKNSCLTYLKEYYMVQGRIKFYGGIINTTI